MSVFNRIRFNPSEVDAQLTTFKTWLALPVTF
jgi:hypothetical protein